MNRRRLLKYLAAVPAIGAVTNTLSAPLFGAATPFVGPATEVTPALTNYQRLRFGCSYHFSTPTFTGDDYDVGKAPATVYNPTHLDVRQWIRVAHGMGAKYAVLTAKYMSGFALWDSTDINGLNYSVAASGNKTDVVAAFVSACKEYGLRSGFYYCILDPHNEGKFDWNAMVSDKYFALIKRQVTQLHSTYPDTFYQLFDITWKLTPAQRWELYRLVKFYNSNCIVVDNQGFKQSRVNQGRFCEQASWPTDVINGEDTLPPLEGHNPHVTFEGKEYYMPFETWLPTGPIYPPMPTMHTWFWHPWYKPQSARVIAEAYRDCMSRNANLLLNLAPDNTGRLPEDQVATMHRVAELIREPNQHC
ncbi:MAG: alpha-L-fucosidase [Acidobacteriaceae bacterium]